MLNLSVLTEPGFCPHSLNKYASVMACGNGYIGIRATHEEDYTQQTRGMYLAGLYHRAGRNETSWLTFPTLPELKSNWMGRILPCWQGRYVTGSES